MVRCELFILLSPFPGRTKHSIGFYQIANKNGQMTHPNFPIIRNKCSGDENVRDIIVFLLKHGKVLTAL